MKFFNYKRYKFSTIFKNISFKHYNFQKILKYLYIKEYRSFKIHKYINLRSIYYHYSKLLKYIDPRRYNFLKLLKYIDPRGYNYSKFYKFLKIKNYKYITVFFPTLILISIFTYLSIPMFYEFNKQKIENLICKGFNVTCSIKSEIKYNFFPSPRIKFNNLVITDPVKNNKTLAKIKDTHISISFKNLHKKEKINYKNLNLKNGVINFDLKNLKKYKNILHTRFNLKNINFKKIDIKFLNNEIELTSINNVVFKYKSKNNIDKVNLEGDFLRDQIIIKLKNNRSKPEVSSNLNIKLVNSKLSSKLDILSQNVDNSLTKGNFSIKKGKNKMLAIFDYKDDQIVLKKGNLKNTFLEGKFAGKLKILPFFNFNLDLNLNSLNFNKLYNILANMKDEKRKNLFKINKKVNGEISLSSNKIYSKYSLFKSFESRAKFINGDIHIEQMLFSLGKLGAADLTGTIKSDKKFTSLKFENNLFIDNLKKFYNKFGIYNKNLKKPASLYTSGTFDLVNLNLRLNEAENEKKISSENVSYYEKEFNNILLDKGYKSLFKFENFKKFVQLTAED